MELSDSILKQTIKDIYFGKSDLCHKEFCDWASNEFAKLFSDDLEPKDLGISDLTAHILMDIDAQWDLFIMNTFPSKELDKLDINKIVLPDIYFESWYRELNNETLGYAESFGWKLLEEIEQKLIDDLNYYRQDREKLRFDWSDTCIEGRSANVKGGKIVNLSNVALIDYNGLVKYEGWIDFVFEEKNNYFFAVYWDKLSYGNNELKDFGLPNHVRSKLSLELQEKYKSK